MRARERADDEAGFSLVELLVVMLILGILAGIAVPTFIGQRGRADDSNAKVVARTAATAMEAYANDNLGAYDGADGTKLNAIDSTIPVNTTVQPIAGCSFLGICYVVTTPASATGTGTTFQLIKLSNGQLLADCSAHGSGGCPSDGHWDG